jgi:hypothetical protein
MPTSPPGRTSERSGGSHPRTVPNSGRVRSRPALGPKGLPSRSLSLGEARAGLGRSSRTPRGTRSTYSGRRGLRYRSRETGRATRLRPSRLERGRAALGPSAGADGWRVEAGSSAVPGSSGPFSMRSGRSITSGSSSGSLGPTSRVLSCPLCTLDGPWPPTGAVALVFQGILGHSGTGEGPSSSSVRESPESGQLDNSQRRPTPFCPR